MLMWRRMWFLLLIIRVIWLFWFRNSLSVLSHAVKITVWKSCMDYFLYQRRRNEERIERNWRPILGKLNEQFNICSPEFLFNNRVDWLWILLQGRKRSRQEQCWCWSCWTSVFIWESRRIKPMIFFAC